MIANTKNVNAQLNTLIPPEMPLHVDLASRPLRPRFQISWEGNPRAGLYEMAICRMECAQISRLDRHTSVSLDFQPLPFI